MLRTIALDKLRFADFVRPGDVIAWPQGSGEPLALTEVLVAQRAELARPELLFGLTVSDTLRPEHASYFRFRGFNGAYNSRRVSDLTEIIPSHLHTFPALIRGGRVKVDITLIQVRPLPNGGFTTGVISDFSGALIDAARQVIALVNPELPITGDDALVDARDIDLLVESDHRIIEMPDADPSQTERRVAERVAELIPDRATIQLGVGTLPTAVAAALSRHRGLGVHTGVVSDVLVDLIDKGIVTNAHKGRDAGVTVTGGLFGTARLRDFAERSGLVRMRNVEYTHAIGIIASLHAFHAINAAIEVDLYGASNTEVAGSRYLGAVGGGVDFVRGGAASAGGRAILAFPSTTPDGKISRIVNSLQGRPVTAARSDADVVVTEFGTAELRGASLHERARRLIAIAHPDFREALERSLHDDASKARQRLPASARPT